MFFFKYTFLVLTLLVWCASSSSIDLYSESEEVQGDREKRTLILGLVFKKLLLQQAFARNARMNSTAVMPPQQMMADSGSSNESSSEAPPLPEQPSTPASPPQPPQVPQGAPPSQSMPQGLRNPPALPQGPPPLQRPASLQQRPLPEGFLPFNGFDPRQQTSLFPVNYPFGVQRFGHQLPFGPAPPLGAQAGPQSATRFPIIHPFAFQNGIFQGTQQQPSLLPPTGPSGPPASQGAPNSQFAPQQPSTGQDSPQEQASPELSQPSGPGPSGPGEDSTQGLSQTLQPNSGPQDSPPPQPSTEPTGPTAPETQNPPAPQEDNSQGLQPNTSPDTAEPSQLPIGGNGLQQFTPNFLFSPGPSRPPPPQEPQRSLPNFSFDPQQSTGPVNAQGPSPAQQQQGPPTNFPPQQLLDNNLQQQFDPQLQQQLSSNGPSDPRNIPQNFQSPNGLLESGPGNNDFFDLRQFAGGDNNIFDYSQGGAPPTTGPSEQQQTQPESFKNTFQNGLFAPSGQEQLSSANDPRSNFAFNGQQLGFSSPFQDSGNFQRNLFQQNFF